VFSSIWGMYRTEDGLIARVAHFPVRGTTPESRRAVERQATDLKLLADEVTNPLRFHLIASRAIGNVQHARFTGVLTPGSVNP
jgi:hypothetical protein